MRGRGQKKWQGNDTKGAPLIEGEARQSTTLIMCFSTSSDYTKSISNVHVLNNKTPALENGILINAENGRHNTALNCIENI